MRETKSQKEQKIASSAELNSCEKSLKKVESQTSKLSSFPVFSNNNARNGQSHFKIGKLKLENKAEKSIQPQLFNFLNKQSNHKNLNTQIVEDSGSNFLRDAIEENKNITICNGEQNIGKGDNLQVSPATACNQEISNKFDVYYNDSAHIMFKNSKSLHKAFKAPTSNEISKSSANEAVISFLDQQKFVKKLSQNSQKIYEKRENNESKMTNISIQITKENQISHKKEEVSPSDTVIIHEISRTKYLYNSKRKEFKENLIDNHRKRKEPVDSCISNFIKGPNILLQNSNEFKLKVMNNFIH